MSKRISLKRALELYDQKEKRDKVEKHIKAKAKRLSFIDKLKLRWRATNRPDLVEEFEKESEEDD